MSKQAINLPGAPARPYSAAVKAGDFIFVSGTVGFINSKTGEKNEGIEAQTKKCMENIKEVLELAGASLDDVVKTTVFITDTEDFAKMNGVYKNYFDKDLPARSTIAIVLVNPEMLIEIECIAYRPQ